jgi:putative flippase GtrA
LAWVVASINSFLFNRAWTFNAKGSEVGAGQAKRFWLVALVAVTLNAGLYTLVVNALPGHPILPSSIIASGVVAIWNFWAMRKFAFRADKS